MKIKKNEPANRWKRRKKITIVDKVRETNEETSKTKILIYKEFLCLS